MATQQDKAVIDLVINGKQSETSLYNIKTAAVNAQKALSRMAETDPGYAKQKKELEALLRAQQERIVRINQEKTAWQRFTADMPSLMAGVTAGNLLSKGISAMASAIPAAISNFREFNAASQDLSAVTGATGKDLEYLNKTAAQTGPQVGKSAAEMLEAYKLMGSAKPELLEQTALLTKTTEAAITLSQAGKIDLASATQVTAESLNQFGESADQANRYINVIAAGANAGSAEINEMGVALKNSGTVAKAQDVSFEQTNALLQSMSSIALKGGEAGTNLRNVLLTLGSGSDDTNPRIVGLDKALENLAAKNLSTAEMTKLFGKENLVAAQHIITHRNEIAELTKRVTGTQDAFRMAETNNASFDHQLEQFGAVVNGISVSIGTKLIPTLTSWLKTGTDLLKQLPDLLSWLSKNGEWLLITGIPALIAYNGTLIKATASAAANTLAEGYRRLAFQAGYTWLLISETATKAYALATGVLTGQITIQTAVVTVARNIWAAFSAILLANPIGIVVGALGGLVAAIKYFSEHTDRALDLERKKSAIQEQGIKNTQFSAKALQDLNQKVAHANELSKAEQENLKKTIVLKQAETRARLAAALARAREVAREAAEPTFWQGVKQGAADFVTGNWGNLAGDGLAKRKAQQTEANKAQAYAEAKAAANVEQLQADIAQFDALSGQLDNQMNTKPSGSGSGGGGGQTDEQKKAAEKKKQQELHDANELKDMLASTRKQIMAGEKSDYEKQVADFAEKYARMYDLAKNSEAETNEVRRLSLIEWAGIEKSYNEKQMQDKREAADRELALEKEKNLAKIEEMVANGEMTREVGNQARLMVEWSYLQDELALTEAHYQALAELYEQDAEKKKEIETKKAEDLAKINAKVSQNEGEQSQARTAIATAEVQHNKEAKEQQARDEKELYNRKKEIFNDSVTVLKFFFKENTLVYKAAMLAQQAYALKDVAINYSRAVMGAIAGASSIPFPANLLAIARGIAIPTLQAAAAYANIRSQKFDVPTFADGGFSDEMPAGFTSGPTYYSKKNFIAGEAGTEWIMSAPMLKNPVMANLAGALQALQVSGQYRNLALPASSQSADAQGAGLSHALLAQIHQQLQVNNQRMEAIAKRPINNNWFEVGRTKDRIAEINTETSL